MQVGRYIANCPTRHGVLAMAGAVPDITLLHVIQYKLSVAITLNADPPTQLKRN